MSPGTGYTRDPRQAKNPRLAHSRTIHVVAQQGNSASFPENTVPALLSAFELGVTAVTLNVQLSADEVPMVIRDPTLMRTCGISSSVCHLSAEELARTSAHEPARFGSSYFGTCIPRLKEVVAMIANRPRATLFMELTRHSLAEFGASVVLARVLAEIRPVLGQCVLTSTDLAAVQQARTATGVRMGWLLESIGSHDQIKAQALVPDFLICPLRPMLQTAALWRGPWRWMAEEVETGQAARDAAAVGAEYVVTRDVQRMVEGTRP